MVLIAKAVDIGTVAAGATAPKTDTVEQDYILRKVLILEKSGAALNKVYVTMRINDKFITKGAVLATVYQVNFNQAPPVDIEYRKGATLHISVENKSTSDVDVQAVLFLEPVAKA